MKMLAIIALLLGLASVGTAVYGMVETKPNYDAMSNDDDLGQGDFALLSDYKGTLMNQVIGAGAAGVIAVVCGIVGFKKTKNKLGLVGALLGVVGAVIGVFVINPNF